MKRDAGCERHDYLGCKYQPEGIGAMEECGCLLKDYLTVPVRHAFCLRFLVWDRKKKKEYCTLLQLLQKILSLFVLSIHVSQRCRQKIVAMVLKLFVVVGDKRKLFWILMIVFVSLVGLYLLNASLLILVLFAVSLLYMQGAYILQEVRECYMIDIEYDISWQRVMDKRISTMRETNEMQTKLEMLYDVLSGKCPCMTMEDLAEVERDTIQKLTKSIEGYTKDAQRLSEKDREKIVIRLLQRTKIEDFYLLSGKDKSPFNAYGQQCCLR